MRYCAILLFLSGYCAFSFSQTLNFSRRFDAAKKNLPLAILNHHTDYFHVLRYNKLAHDIIIEKRAKPTAELIAFTPLRLDEINASWFDYRNLDHLFFEQDHQLYFVFEKVVNTKKTIYMKVTDSLARASAFIELASIETDHSAKDFSFEFKTTFDNNILIVASMFYQNHVSKKVMLYDIKARKLLWTRRLPIENDISGYSSSFECNDRQDLYYAVAKSKVTAYQRRYINHMQVEVPVYFYEEINLVSYLHTDPVTIRTQPLLANLNSYSGLQIVTDHDAVFVQSWFSVSANDGAMATVFLLNSKLDAGLERRIYQVVTPLDTLLEKQLSFYDGGDYKQPAYKEYRLIPSLNEGKKIWSGVERQDQDYSKELVVWSSDPENGRVTNQLVIPRKLYGFKTKTRFRYAGDALGLICKERPCYLMAEASANLERKAANFNYHKFRVESNLWKANIVMYCINEKGIAEKRLLYQNAAFDLIPLRYSSSNVKDVIFYFASGKYEKFAILPGE